MLIFEPLAEKRDIRVPFVDDPVRLLLGEAEERYIREWAKPLPRGPKWKYRKIEWARMFEEFEAGDYEDYCGTGVERPSDLGICERIALDDFEKHSERWSYDPREKVNAKKAAQRIWMALFGKPDAPMAKTRELLEEAKFIREVNRIVAESRLNKR